MSEPYVGEILVVGFNFAPTGFASCDGQILAIAQNTALFSLLGTNYGGNGQTTFALPDFRRRAPTNQGQGPGLSNRNVGEAGGIESVTLVSDETPAHSHVVQGDQDTGTLGDAAGNYLAASPVPVPVYLNATPNTALNLNTVAPAGGSQPHSNQQPYLALHFIIALQGIFPPRE